MRSWWTKTKSLFGAAPKKKPGLPAPTSVWGTESATAWTAAATLDLYNSSGYLRAIADLIGNGVAQARWRVYKRVDGTKAVRDYGLSGAGYNVRTKALATLKSSFEVVEIPNHRLLQILENPSADFTGYQTLKLIQVHLDLAGEAFLLLTRDQSGQVAGFVPIPPSCVSSTPSAGDPFYRVSYETLIGAVPASEILHLKHPNPAAPMRRGSGLGAALGDELAAAESIGKAVKAAMGRSGLPVAMVAVDAGSNGGAPGEAVEDLQKQWAEQYGRPEHAGKVMFASGKLSFTALNANFRELQTNELGQQLLAYVRQCFGVSVEMLGDMTGANRSRADAARWIFADQVLAARLEFLRTCLQKWLVPLVDPAVILHYDDIRPSDHARLLQAMTCVPNQAFTWNEVRVHLAGLEPLEALGDSRPLPMPGQTAPVQSLDEEGQPVPEPETDNE